MNLSGIKGLDSVYLGRQNPFGWVKAAQDQSPAHPFLFGHKSGNLGSGANWVRSELGPRSP